MGAFILVIKSRPLLKAKRSMWRCRPPTSQQRRRNLFQVQFNRAYQGRTFQRRFQRLNRYLRIHQKSNPAARSWSTRYPRLSQVLIGNRSPINSTQTAPALPMNATLTGHIRKTTGANGLCETAAASYEEISTNNGQGIAQIAHRYVTTKRHSDPCGFPEDKNKLLIWNVVVIFEN